MRPQPEASHSRRDGPRGRPAGRAAAATRALSLVLIAAGALTLAWVLVTLTWQEPITAVETWGHQARSPGSSAPDTYPFAPGRSGSRHAPTGSRPTTGRRWDES